MPAHPVIKRFACLEKLHVFRKYVAPVDLPILRKHNLIYGFNGCGKTTLAKLLSSLGSGVLDSTLPTDCVFKIELTDGRTISNGEVIDQLKERVFVFNDDFVEANFHWKEGKANPVFYISKEQKEFADALQKKIKEKGKTVAQHETAEDLYKKGESAFVQHKRDNARAIAEQLNLGRRYEAPQLVDDYAAAEYGKECIVADEERRKLRGTITLDMPDPKIEEVEADGLDIGSIAADVRNLLAQTLGSISVEELQQHDTMLIWVKGGLEYHRDKELTTCLFCGNELKQERLDTLATVLDDRFTRLLDQFTESTTAAERVRDDLSRLRAALPAKGDIARGHRELYGAALVQLQESIVAAEQMVTNLIQALVAKARSPNVPIIIDGYLGDDGAKLLDKELAERLATLNGVIAKHNITHDDFATAQEEARRRLKEHYLAESQADFRELESDVKKAGKIRAVLVSKITESNRNIEDLKRAVRRHGPAAKLINKMVHAYLGHKELEITTVDDGYELLRNGKRAEGQPSEGEKTAIVLCYFLVLLQGDGRKLKDLIVVLDDPISSLDTRALNYASAMIQSALNDTGQLIVLTHNIQLMNDLKKWMKPRTESGREQRGKSKEGAQAALFYVDMIQPGSNETRVSSIIEMPKYIREYESEYQYLFHLMLRFREHADDQLNYFFVMPNALRKILDVFLAFKEPGGMGLAPKLQKIAADNCIDSTRMLALERLVQAESHADNLDDLVTLSSITIEETKDAVEAILAFMKAVDETHHDKMCSLCKV